MVKLRREFLDEFGQRGFGFVQGSRWMEHNSEQEVTCDVLYFTKNQILHEERDDDIATDGIIKTAEALGEGRHDGNHHGYFKYPSRNNVIR